MVRYNQVVKNLALLPNFITYYEKELDDARNDCGIVGSVEKQVQRLPGVTEHRFNQLQEIEAMLNFMNIQLRKVRQKHYKKYLESYAKALSSRDAEKYADAEDEVVDFEVLVNEVALLRNKFLGVIKAIESKNFQLGHIVRLRAAGLEDITI